MILPIDVVDLLIKFYTKPDLKKISIGIKTEIWIYANLLVIGCFINNSLTAIFYYFLSLVGFTEGILKITSQITGISSILNLIIFGFFEEVWFRGWISQKAIIRQLSVLTFTIFNILVILLNPLDIFLCIIPFLFMNFLFIHYAKNINQFSHKSVIKVLISSAFFFAYYHIVDIQIHIQDINNFSTFIALFWILFIRFPSGIILGYVRVKFGLIKASVFHILLNCIIILTHP